MLFGVFDIMQVPEETSSADAFAQHLEDAVRADQLGLDLYFVAERHFMPMYRTPSPGLWLATVAARTESIRLGALAYTVPLHNPVRLAEEVSMLDHLSGGRIEAGVGVGHRTEELESLGINPKHRQLLMFESLVLMQKAWRGEQFSFPGSAFKFNNLYVDPPIQQPHPPLWFAGNDPRAADWAAKNNISLAVGFQNDGLLLAPVMAFKKGREEVGGQPGERPYISMMRHLYVAESDDQARREMIDDVMRLGQVLAASPRQMAKNEPLKEMSREEADASVQDMLDKDIIVAGSPETCAQRLARSARFLSLDVFLANPYLTGVDQERVQRTLTLYAERVAPRVQDLMAAHAARETSRE